MKGAKKKEREGSRKACSRVPVEGGPRLRNGRAGETRVLTETSELDSEMDLHTWQKDRAGESWG